MEAALGVVRYIKEAPSLVFLIPTESTNKLVAYYDFDLEERVETKMSIIGYLVKFRKALIS